MKVYRAGKKGIKWREFGDYKEARKDFVSMISGNGPFLWKMKGTDKWQGPVTQPTLLKKLDHAQPSMDQTDQFWAKASNGRTVFVLDCGNVELQFPKPPPGISPSIARAHNITFAEAEKLQLETGIPHRIVTMGYTVCKLIAGTRTPSQHCPGPPSPTGGNAMDWIVQKFVNGKWVADIPSTDHVKSKLVSEGYPEVLWRGVPNHYPNHAHTSGNPKRSGWPACL